MSPALGTFRVADDEASRVFTTYSNYLCNVKNLLEGTYGAGADFHDGLTQKTRELRALRRVQRSKLDESKSVKIVEAAKLSWAHEAQLRLRGLHDPELLPDLLHGSASEAYYAAYHAARALFLAGNFSAGDNHTSGLNTLSTIVGQRQLLPAPWSVHCVGGPDRTQFECRGLPPGVPSPQSVSSLAVPRPDSIWDSLFLALSTTRDRRLDELRADWRTRTGKKRTPRVDSERIAASLPATTMFNFLWRLRKRSDYRDADIFMHGIWSPSQAAEYHGALSTLVMGSVTVLNTVMVAYAGIGPIEKASTVFLRRPDVYDAVAQRRASLLR